MPHPHLDQVPRDYRENLIYRAKILGEGNSSKQRARELKQMASEDMLWYMNTFVWVHDPWITDGDRVIPLITRPYQDNFLEEFYWAIMRQYDLHMRKCRRVLASWGALVTFDWFATTHRDMSFCAISAKEALVDSVAGRKKGERQSESGKRSALMPKLDLVHKKLPIWMRPKIYRKKLYMGYTDTGSEIEGIATVPEHGTRYTAMLCDEMARWDEIEPGLDYTILEATRGAVRCRLMVSTPDDMSNAFHEMESDGIYKRRVFWWEDPIYRKDIHIGRDGQLHSPWYDKEAARCATDREKITQLDGEYAGSSSQFFPFEVVEQRVSESRPPMYVGQWDHSDGNPVAFVKGNAGPLSLWCELPDGKPPSGEYVAGADICTGTPDCQGRGYSNSVLAIYSQDNGHKVAEYVISSLLPFEFASACVALMRWFSDKDAEDVYIAWESGGPGKEFGPIVQRYGWTNFYLRKMEQKLGQEATLEPGYNTTRGTKISLLGQYRAALKTGKIRNWSLPALQECNEFVRGPGNEIIHKPKGNMRDKLTARHPHGDRVIADALACLAMGERETVIKEQPRKIPEHSAYHRIEAVKSEREAVLAGEPTRNRRTYAWA